MQASRRLRDVILQTLRKRKALTRGLGDRTTADVAEAVIEKIDSADYAEPAY